MRTRLAFLTLIAASILGSASPVRAAIQLTPIVSGLSSPLFVGHAGDGSNRLFIVERGGRIYVLQSGASSPTVFLNVQALIVAGGEQGLLGLAFHPQYMLNRRFFVFYTRSADGALTVAEYRASAADPNVADPAGTVLLTIPHPTFANHNGGMLEFGTDGFLYIGVGDGGSGDDPPNNAQNIDVLLGKILRIDVDHPDAANGTPYSSPSGNPYVGRAGRDEIFVIGMRNPWRFSFDRFTGQQWVGDVGQGAKEEVDTPIDVGANYGWRVFEGFSCTGNDPDLCDAGIYTAPLFEYAHTLGRCSLTGGYVYRGSQGALPNGTYVYGDYCSGEIFAWDGSTQSVLLDTALNISSFGEDEQGELYVVGLGGTVSKIVASAPCTLSIAPRRETFQVGGGTGSVAVIAGAGCAWTAVSNDGWITITGGAMGSGNGTVSYSVAPYTGKPRNRNGSMTIAGSSFAVKQSR